jgi:isoleucyl-tRNA synthetase
MHKSLGNAVAPEEFVNSYGADVLRLWVASTDYRSEVCLTNDIAKQLSDIYLKIRNTARFILGNLGNFDPNDLVSFGDMPELDRWALARLNRLVTNVRASYEKYEYHTIYHAIHNFCTVDMSNFYLDIIKDRLYCEEANSLLRRSAQTVMYNVLDALVRMLAPVLAFTSEEIWALMPHHSGVELDSVLYNLMPEPDSKYELTPELEAMWDDILSLRTDVYKALELARIDKVIGKSLEAEVTLSISESASAAFDKIADKDFKMLFIVSDVHIVRNAVSSENSGGISGVTVDVNASKEPKCVRCWKHDKDVGKSEKHPELCPRCLDVVLKLGR